MVGPKQMVEIFPPPHLDALAVYLYRLPCRYSLICLVANLYMATPRNRGTIHPVASITAHMARHLLSYPPRVKIPIRKTLPFAIPAQIFRRFMALIGRLFLGGWFGWFGWLFLGCRFGSFGSFRFAFFPFRFVPFVPLENFSWGILCAERARRRFPPPC